MKAVFDTSSLISLVKYYLPFDSNSTLLSQIEEHIISGDMVIIDEVLNECKGMTKGIVLTQLPFLCDAAFLKKHKVIKNTESMVPPAPRKFSNMLNNQFVNHTMRKGITDAVFDVAKKEFMDSADARMVIYLLNEINKNPGGSYTLITEESKSNNDNKYFIKLPSICEHLEIQCMNLPSYITQKGTLKIDISPANFVK